MNRTEANDQTRESRMDEVHKDVEEEARAERRFLRWKRGTLWLGIALIASVAADIPYLQGHPLHDKWDAVGKKIVVLSMFLFLAFVYSAATTYNFWWGLRKLRAMDKKYAPPGSS
jgi:hypothetical protein